MNSAKLESVLTEQLELELELKPKRYINWKQYLNSITLCYVPHCCLDSSGWL